jgi:Synaptobrevin
MPIQYCSILFNNKVISDYFTGFESTSQIILDHLINTSKHIKSSNGPYIYSKSNSICGLICVNENYHVVCFSSKDTPNHIIANFLNTVSEEISFAIKNTGNIQNDPKLNKILKDNFEYYNDPKNDKIKKIKSQLEETKVIILDNLDSVIERNVKIDQLCDQSSNLLQSAQTFEDNSKKLKCAMWCKNIKMWIAIIFALIVLCVVIAMCICDINFSKCKNNNNNHQNNNQNQHTVTSPPPMHNNLSSHH